LLQYLLLDVAETERASKLPVSQESPSCCKLHIAGAGAVLVVVVVVGVRVHAHRGQWEVVLVYGSDGSVGSDSARVELDD
jgi:hypothetical protein